ncbi:MAG: HAD family hydrolase [Planctomycetota bacterium]
MRFVKAVTSPDSPDFLPVPERIAVFDNDGTLWPEQPLIQAVFLAARAKAMLREDPSWADREPAVAAAASGDFDYFHREGEAALMALVAATSAGMTDAEFNSLVDEFFATSTHPTLGKPFTGLAYQPMVEFLDLLRSEGFQVFICSGGGMDFVRRVSGPMYGIPAANVIGSSLAKEVGDADGRTAVWRLPELASFNDRAEKVKNIALHLGARPVVAGGNVRSGGDIAMLTYSSEGPGPSLQLVVNHDDPEREFAYAEADRMTLNAAEKNDFLVISIKDDWVTVFDDGPPEPYELSTAGENR